MPITFLYSVSMLLCSILHTLTVFFFFFNDTATTEIYTLSLHDALPIYTDFSYGRALSQTVGTAVMRLADADVLPYRSEEHTSELQSLRHLVCRLLLEKKKKGEQSGV